MIHAEPIVQLTGITKRFGKIVALDNVTLDVSPGKIIGLLGDNGAGKSTLLRHMIGLYLPDEGECITLGIRAGDLDPARLARVGYVHQNGELIEWMTVRQLIRYVSAYYDAWNPKIEERFVREFELSLNVRVGALSPGQRQRLAILLAIGFEPELLILDEPAAALDPIARMRFLDLLTEFIQDEGRTIIISSHILSDVEKIIDHVVIMRRGRILRDCALEELQEEYCRVRLTAVEGRLPEVLPFDGVLECERDDVAAVLLLRRPDDGVLRTAEASLCCRVECEALSLETIYRAIVELETEEIVPCHLS